MPLSPELLERKGYHMAAKDLLVARGVFPLRPGREPEPALVELAVPTDFTRRERLVCVAEQIAAAGEMHPRPPPFLGSIAGCCRETGRLVVTAGNYSLGGRWRLD